MSRLTAIEALAANPPAAALVLDFDGVLAPIIEDPTASLMPRRAAASLSSLARSLRVIAVISGRPAEFLAQRVAVPAVRLIGSYGMERLSDGELQIDQAARRWLGKVADAGQELSTLLAGVPGLRIEAKPVSVAVHWRQARDRNAAAAAVRRATTKVAATTGLRLAPGKLVSELRPPIDVDKGSAVAALISDVRPAVIAYAGDDLGDVPALQAVREAGGYALVVDHGTETDPRLLDVADEVYQGTDRFADWLADLAAACGG